MLRTNDLLHRRLMIGVAVLGMLLSGRSTRGNDSALEKELETVVAKKILPLLEKKNMNVVAVGAFSSAADLRGSAGPAFQLLLTKVLQDKKVTVSTKNFQCEIQGAYRPKIHENTKLQGYRLVLRVIDNDGSAFGEFACDLLGVEEVASRLGVGVRVKPAANLNQTSDELKQQIESPTSFLNGARVSNSKDSPYAIEVLRKDGEGFLPVNAELGEDGRPLASLDRQTVFAIKLINHSDHEAAVNLRMDGINVFAFSETSPDGWYWIVSPRNRETNQPGELVIPGWHRDGKKVFEFKVVDIPQGALAILNLKPDESLGMITAEFRAAWSERAGRPKDEPTEGSRAVGLGDQRDFPSERVQRSIGTFRELIAVRYER